MPEIRFTKTAFSTTLGTFGPGDLLRCDDATAAHFVQQAQCAVIVQPQPDKAPPAPGATDAAPAVARRRRTPAAPVASAPEPAASDSQSPQDTVGSAAADMLAGA